MDIREFSAPLRYGAQIPGVNITLDTLTAADIAPSAVGTSELADLGVTTAKIEEEVCPLGTKRSEAKN